MPWIQIKINTTNASAESIGEELTKLGALSVTFQDTFDTPIFEPLPGETRLWGNTDVIGLFDVNTNVSALEAALYHSSLITETTPYTVEILEDKDWSREWMDNFHPISFGHRLWICPSWRPVPNENAVNVILDPGLAFGTGSHPTTALCLRWLDNLDLTGKTVIDYGCGSGILAIAALKLGAAYAIGVDIDPQALEASQENAKRNTVENRLELYLPTQLDQNTQADVVIANILAGPIKSLASQISGHVKPNGLLGLSGILLAQAAEVCTAYQSDFTLDPVEYDDDWCRITGRKIPS